MVGQFLLSLWPIFGSRCYGQMGGEEISMVHFLWTISTRHESLNFVIQARDRPAVGFSFDEFYSMSTWVMICCGDRTHRIDCCALL